MRTTATSTGWSIEPALDEVAPAIVEDLEAMP